MNWIRSSVRLGGLYLGELFSLPSSLMAKDWRGIDALSAFAAIDPNVDLVGLPQYWVVWRFTLGEAVATSLVFDAWFWATPAGADILNRSWIVQIFSVAVSKQHLPHNRMYLAYSPDGRQPCEIIGSCPR